MMNPWFSGKKALSSQTVQWIKGFTALRHFTADSAPFLTWTMIVIEFLITIANKTSILLANLAADLKEVVYQYKNKFNFLHYTYKNSENNKIRICKIPN